MISLKAMLLMVLVLILPRTVLSQPTNHATSSLIASSADGSILFPESLTDGDFTTSLRWDSINIGSILQFDLGSVHDVGCIILTIENASGTL